MIASLWVVKYTFESLNGIPHNGKKHYKWALPGLIDWSMQIYIRVSDFPFGKDHGYKLCYLLCLLMVAQLEWVEVFSRGLAVRGFYDYSISF